jgi:hypothetical protein
MQRIIIREGLETPEQRAWWFANLKDDEGSTGSSSGKSDPAVTSTGGQDETSKNIDAFHNTSSYNDSPEAQEYSDKAMYHYNRLEPSEKDALHGYVGQPNPYVNRYLRGDIPTWKTDPEGSKALWLEDQAKAVKGMDAAIAKSEVPEGTVLYRGVRGDIKVGDVSKNVGYTSTTRSALHASVFAEPTMDNTTRVIRVETEKGQRGLFSDRANHIREREVVLPRGTSMRIERVEPITVNGNKWEIYHAKILKGGK